MHKSLVSILTCISRDQWYQSSLGGTQHWWPPCGAHIVWCRTPLASIPKTEWLSRVSRQICPCRSYPTLLQAIDWLCGKHDELKHALEFLQVEYHTTTDIFQACITSLTQQLKGITDGIVMDKPLVNVSVEQWMKWMASCAATFAVVVLKKSSRNCIPQASICNVCQEIASPGQDPFHGGISHGPWDSIGYTVHCDGCVQLQWVLQRLCLHK